MVGRDVEPSNRDELSIIKSPRSFASAVMFHRCLLAGFIRARAAPIAATPLPTLSLVIPTLACTLLNPCSSSHLRDRRRKALHALRDRIGLLVRKT